MIKRFTFLFGLFLTAVTFGQNPAINFDGTNDYIQTTFGGVTGSADRTFEAWIYIDPAAPASNLCILDYGSNAAGDRNTFAVSGTRKLTFTSGGTNANIGSTNTNVVTAGVWTHVAFVLDAGTGYVYVNGVLEGSGNLSNVSTPTTGNDMTIGQRVPGGSIPFNGSIDEVRVYDVARSATEIQADMNSEVCNITSSLVAYYRMNDGIINGTNMATTIDESGNNNSGTLNNFALSGTSSNWTTGPVLGTGLTNSTLVVNSCNDYTGPSGTVYTASGLYTETVTNSVGCDSIIQLDLTIAPLTSSINETVCNSYVSPSGTYTWTASGLYADTLVTAGGCDSVISINLTVDSYQTTVIASGCDSYTSFSGNNTWTTSGLYSETFSTVFGCDSVINYDVTIYGGSTGNVTETICAGETYTSPTGMTYTTSGTYFDTLTDMNGCDSVVTINLTVNNVINTVSTSGATLTADQTGAAYQWYRCTNGVFTSMVVGETSISYTPVASGNYGVELLYNGCLERSSCYLIDYSGIEDANAISATIFPNPTTGNFSITLGNNYSNVSIQVIDVQGKVVASKNVSHTTEVMVNEGLSSGVYFVQLKANQKTSTYKVVVL